HRRDRSNYRGRDAGQSRTIFQQCGAAISGDYFFDRTTEVQINEIWTHPINDLARRFRHVLAVGTEELHTHWPFDLIKIQVITRPGIAAENSFGRNEFGRENVSAIFFAELPENFVRDPGHRREVKRKLFEKPGKKHVDLSTMCRGLEQVRHFVLHVFQLVEPQLRIGYDEYIASRAVFVNQHTTISTLFSLHSFQV